MVLLDKLDGRYCSGTLHRLRRWSAAWAIAVHLAIVWLLFRGLGVGFPAAQVAATLVAMTINYALNNELTYRDVRLRGWRG